ncbi:MAG: fumarylacetoacetate hydrolase family protein [Bacteroidetes bacterium]|nr:fumarylacetoacetate hydrolase family protein [Bacteroidota bacterium]
MKLFNTQKGIYLEFENQSFKLESEDWDYIVNQDSLTDFLKTCKKSPEYLPSESDFLPPIKNQEIWASGVTYLRSKKARMEESKDAGGGDFYDRVYDADRPELFFKATAARTVGHQQNIKIRKDSKWNVPEPEFTLFVNSQGKIAGYTVGNDISSRDIEGENPLYLPQAKSYDKSAAIGPCLYVFEGNLGQNSEINLEIIRNNEIVFAGNTSTAQMKRNFTELVAYLTRECSFPHGCYLMTGTGIIPPDDFSMISGDIVKITIEKVGTLINTVE